MGKGTLGTGVLELEAFAGPAAPLFFDGCSARNAPSLPCLLTRLTQLVPTPGSASAPTPVSGLRRAPCAASAPVTTPLRQAAPLTPLH